MLFRSHLRCEAGRPRTLYSGPTTANGFDARSPLGDRARDHRELNRRDNPRQRSKEGLKAPARPVDGKRKPGRVHVVRKARSAFRDVVRTRSVLTASGKSPISRNDERRLRRLSNQTARSLRSLADACESPAPLLDQTGEAFDPGFRLRDQLLEHRDGRPHLVGEAAALAGVQRQRLEVALRALYGQPIERYGDDLPVKGAEGDLEALALYAG